MMPESKNNSILKEIQQTFQSALRLDGEDRWVIDFLVALAATNTRANSPEPVWGFLVGPPGSAKTEILRSLTGWEQSVHIDELTENALASGYEDDEGHNPSLLPALDHKLLVIKEFTGILKAPQTIRNKVVGTLRGAFDDTYSKADGKSGLKAYKCKFGIVAAVTPVVDTFLQEDQQLGQRFVACRLARTAKTARDRERSLKHVIIAARSKALWRTSIAMAMQHNLDLLRKRINELQASQPVGASLINMTDENIEALIRLADLAVRIRTLPAEGEGPSESEFAGRLVQQLMNLVECRVVADGRSNMDETDFMFARRIIQDTLPVESLRLVSTFVSHSTPPGEATGGRPNSPPVCLTPDQLAGWSHVGLPMVYRVLRQFQYLGMVARDVHRDYYLTAETKNLLVESQLASPITQYPTDNCL